MRDIYYLETVSRIDKRIDDLSAREFDHHHELRAEIAEMKGSIDALQKILADLKSELRNRESRRIAPSP